MDKRMCSLLSRIRELKFTVTELTMYLDTHPDESEMRAKLCEAQKQLRQLKEEYRRAGGMLEPCGCGDSWAWIDDPWPWEFAAN